MDWALGLTIGLEARAVEISHVRQWFSWLHTSGRRTSDAAADLDRPKLPDPLPRPMEDEDLERARLSAEPEIRAWLTLAGYAGMRCCEIAALRRDDIRIGRQTVLHVRGKGRRDRNVPASSLVIDELQRWGIARRLWIFPRRDGRAGPRQPHNVSHLGNEWLSACGVDSTMHRARHRFATRLYEETRDIVLVQRLLGHASLSTTQRYVGWADLDAVDAVERILPGERRPWTEKALAVVGVAPIVLEQLATKTPW
jgi:integrase/recombinase XerC